MRMQLYIDGKWVDGNGTMPVYDPSDGSIIAEVATAGEAEVEAAIAAAHRAQPSGRPLLLDIGANFYARHSN